MRLRNKQLLKVWKRKEEAYKVRKHAETAAAAPPTSKKK